MSITSIIDNYNNDIIQSTNNFPLINLSTGTAISSSGQVKNLYEVYYKNLKSYPYTIDISNENYFITVYTLPNDKTITLTTDMKDPNTIISTFSGDVPANMPLVKTVHITPTEITITYT